jgi:ABC-type sugar transport system ATPase subunit
VQVARLELSAVGVVTDGTRVLEAVDLTVPDGTRTVVLGASGSGKTTLLRAVAGVTPVTSGRVWFDDRDVTDLPARDRDVAFVSQQGALQPHLDVGRNLGFALRLRRVPRAEEHSRVEAEARAFSLGGMLHRRPRTLSAGERHEVALARTLVRPSAVLLLDEPFAQIDAARRGVLRRELARVQEGYGVTLVATTNDPVTALALAQQIVVLEDGRVLQVGLPGELLARPASTFVAGLLLTPAMNLLPGRVEGAGAFTHLVAGPLRIPAARVPPGASRRVTLGVRPADVELGGRGPDVPVRGRTFLGAEVELTVGRAGDPPIAAIVPRPAPEVGDRVRLRVAPERVHLFDPVTGFALVHGV